MRESTAEGSQVLLVEDHVMLRRALATSLREAGFRIIEAATGADALALLEQGLRPRILLSDVRMPGHMNGLQLAQAARRILPTLPVLLTTGYNDLQAQEFRLLLKPYTPAELLLGIRELLGEDG